MRERLSALKSASDEQRPEGVVAATRRRTANAASVGCLESNRAGSLSTNTTVTPGRWPLFFVERTTLTQETAGDATVKSGATTRISPLSATNGMAGRRSEHPLGAAVRASAYGPVPIGAPTTQGADAPGRRTRYAAYRATPWVSLVAPTSSEDSRITSDFGRPGSADGRVGERGWRCCQGRRRCLSGPGFR